MLLSLIFTLSSALAQTDLDTRLNGYIQKFALTSLSEPAAKREAIYNLGQRLYMDPRLSGNNNVNCMVCHHVSVGTGDAIPLGLGEGAVGAGTRRTQRNGAILLRNTTPLYNLGLDSAAHLFWDGRVAKNKDGWLTPEPGLNGADPELADVARTLDSVLAAQALFPIASPEEMLGQGSPLSRKQAWENVVSRLMNGTQAAEYERMFADAFGITRDEVNIGHVGNALAEFQRHLFWYGDSPWDLYLEGETEILYEELKQGALVFLEKGQCTNCHKGEQLSSFGFQAVGVPQLGVAGTNDLGRYDVTKKEADKYKFRVAPLRNVAITAPYMHNGVFGTLWEVIDHYNNPAKMLMEFVWRSTLTNYNTPLTLDVSPENQLARLNALSQDLPKDLQLTEEERAQLWCFLTVGLTDITLQQILIEQGVQNENPRCVPIVGHHKRIRR